MRDRDFAIYDAVVRNNRSIRGTAAGFGVSERTVRRTLDKVSDYYRRQPKNKSTD